jgi:hypothetical protein
MSLCDEVDRAGLCATCAHVQRVVSSKESTFYRCRLADIDPRFRRYPVLPVLACAGYEEETRSGPQSS